MSGRRQKILVLRSRFLRSFQSKNIEDFPRKAEGFRPAGVNKFALIPKNVQKGEGVTLDMEGR